MCHKLHAFVNSDGLFYNGPYGQQHYVVEENGDHMSDVCRLSIKFNGHFLCQ